MWRIKFGKPIFVAGLVSFLTMGCSADVSAPAGPKVSVVASAGSNSLPIAAPYSGVFQPGRHIVCTSKFSVMPGHYVITVENPQVGDEWVAHASVAPGECAVVFQTSRQTGPESLILITPGPIAVFSAVVTFTTFCDPHCQPWCDPVYLLGSYPSISKFYFTKPRPNLTGLDISHDPTPCEVYSGHGGTGTINFGLD